MGAGDAEHILVHGLGRYQVPPEWIPLTKEEVGALLASYLPAADFQLSPVEISWHSPRPQSSAALVETGAGTFFVKRHHRSVRSANDLRVEHAFAGHLNAEGQQVPRVVAALDGATTVELGAYVYEVHELLAGADLYREAISWSPFKSPAHARAAGSALARFHLAARRFLLPPRLPGVLMNSSALVAASSPTLALRHLMNLRPELLRAPVARALPEDFERYHLDLVNSVSPFLAVLEPQWGHGDWHPSNLAWSPGDADASVVGLFDLGLANRTFAMHDLALAIERSTIDWLDLAGRGEVGVDFDALDSLLDGYVGVTPLRAYEEQALIGLLPVVHIEYALSEVEYYSGVLDDQENAELVYDGYFVGHTRWFAEGGGGALLDHLRARFATSGATR
jgi:Ser/Thr protein kinase RdoA (MazF antagonist)